MIKLIAHVASPSDVEDSKGAIFRQLDNGPTTTSFLKDLGGPIFGFGCHLSA
jgi:hypothetical protein